MDKYLAQSYIEYSKYMIQLVLDFFFILVFEYTL